MYAKPSSLLSSPSGLSSIKTQMNRKYEILGEQRDMIFKLNVLLVELRKKSQMLVYRDLENLAIIFQFALRMVSQ